MDNVTFVEREDLTTGIITEHAIIDHGNDQFTSMLKSTYDTLVTESAPTA